MRCSRWLQRSHRPWASVTGLVDAMAAFASSQGLTPLPDPLETVAADLQSRRRPRGWLPPRRRPWWTPYASLTQRPPRREYCRTQCCCWSPTATRNPEELRRAANWRLAEFNAGSHCATHLRRPVHCSRPGSAQHHDAKDDAVPRKAIKTVRGDEAQQPAHAYPSCQERHHQPHCEQGHVSQAEQSALLGTGCVDAFTNQCRNRQVERKNRWLPWRDRPSSMPPMMVAPLRLVPGIMARHCTNPTFSASFQSMSSASRTRTALPPAAWRFSAHRMMKPPG